MDAGDDLLPLASVEVLPRSLPFRRPYVTARGRLTHRETVLLRIRTREGTVGWGEAVPLSLRGDETVQAVGDQLRTWGEAARAAGSAEERSFTAAPVAGSPPALSLATAGAALGPPARCAVETAVADCQARRLGVPLHEMLVSRGNPEAAEAKDPASFREGSSAGPASPGATPSSARIFCNATLTSGSPEEVRRQAEEWAADGFTVFKLKLGPEGDTGQAAAVRKALGPDVKIRLDVNACWSVDQAEREIRALEEIGLELVEQPVATLEEMALLREKVTVPLVADESVSGPADARRAAELGACDAATVKLSKIGSLDSSLGGHLPTYLSSALDGPVGIAAAAHVAVAARSGHGNDRWSAVGQGLATQRLFEPGVFSGGPALDGPWLSPPAGSGLGITPNVAD